MKKRLMAALLAATMAFGLAACGGSNGGSNGGSGNEGGNAGGGSSAEGVTWESGVNVAVDVPAKAGGGTDLYTRYLTQALTDVTGANFVVTNYDTEEVGMQHGKNADGDGLTVLTCHGGAIIKYLTGASEVNISEDMKVAGILNQGGPQAIITNPDAPYTNFAELGEYIKAHPGEVTVGCSLGGTTQVLFTALIDALTGGQPDLVNYVQCSNEADKLTNVASNAINIANCSIPNAMAYDADGKLTILGTLGPKVSTLDSMSELLGETLDAKYASTVEQGIDVTWDSCYYVLVPASTSDETCKMINDAICKAVENEEFVKGNQAMATFIAAVNYDDAKAALANEWTTLDELTKSMGLNVRE